MENVAQIEATQKRMLDVDNNLENLAKEKREYAPRFATSTDPHIRDVIEEQISELETAVALNENKIARLDD